MKKVNEESPFITEKAKQLFPEIDFADTFSTTNQINTIEEITNLVFNNPPKWVKKLFKLRNKIANIFNLNTEMPADYNEEFKVGGYVSFFKIYYLDSNEVIMGANDSHLNFRAIVKNEKSPLNNIKVTTLVKFNNKKGKIYMKVIKPFHRLVVKRMVRNAYREKR